MTEPSFRTQPDRIEIVQAFRALAATLVLLWHASFYVGGYGQGLGGLLFLPAGNGSAVDLFFLVSGFIMVVSTQRADGSVRYAIGFFVRRLFRIWPVYLAATLAYLLTVSLTGTAGSFEHQRFLWSMIYVLPKVEFIPPITYWPTLGIGWTLNYEMYFYLVFALALAAGRWRWPLFFGWFALSVVAPALLSGNYALDTVFYRLPLAHMQMMASTVNLLFVSGVVIGLIYVGPYRIADRRRTRVLLLIGFAFAAWQYLDHFRIQHGPLQAGLSLTPLMFFAVMAHKTAPVKVPRPIVHLGEISYSLYIFHTGVIAASFPIFGWIDPAGVLPGAVCMLLVFLASVALASLTHRYLEVSLSNWLRRRFTALVGLDRPAGRPVHAAG